MRADVLSAIKRWFRPTLAVRDFPPPREDGSADSERTFNSQDLAGAVDAIKGANIADALGDLAQRTRRALLALSVIALVLAAYGINVRQIPWLEIPAPDDADDLVPTLVVVALVYHWAAFALYGISDILKWEAGVQSSQFASLSQLVHRANVHLNALEHLHADAPAGENQRAQIERAWSLARDAEDKWNRFYSLTRYAMRTKRAVVWGWEYSLPLVLGALALWRIVSRLLGNP